MKILLNWNCHSTFLVQYLMTSVIKDKRYKKIKPHEDMTVFNFKSRRKMTTKTKNKDK